MSEYDAVIANASDNTAGVFGLSPETQAVLFFALATLQNLNLWRDDPSEQFSDTDIDNIVELLDWASDELMREVSAVPVGSIMIWLDAIPPEGWLICDGSGALKAEWPELYAHWGNKYAETVDFFGLPDMRQRSPYGATFEFELDTVKGSETHTLTVNEIPAHRHTQRIGTAAGSNALAVGTTTQGNSTVTRDNLNDAGGGQAHNNVHPVYYVNYIVYAGKRAEV